jgi:catechol 2,3-dioxygenase-like lactoylglutathione lyase family enzyme
VKVKRIVSNVAASDVEKASAFYKDVLGLKVLMDLGWIRTYGLRLKDDDSDQCDVTRRIRHCCPRHID